MMRAILWGCMAAAALGTAAPAAPVKIDLDFDTAFRGTGSERATVPGEAVNGRGLFADFYGVRISINRNDNATSGGAPLPAVLYDSDCFGNDCTGDDADLATGAPFGTPSQGRVLILHENPNTFSTVSGPDGNGGTVTVPGSPNPDDDADGGTITFEFDEALYPLGIDLRIVDILDLDEDVIDTKVSFEIEKANVDFIANPGQVAPALSTEILLLNQEVTGTPNGCNASNDGPTANVCENDNALREFVFAGRQVENLRRVSVTFANISGAISALAFNASSRATRTPVPTPGSLTLLLSAIGMGVLTMRTSRRAQSMAPRPFA